MAKLRHVAIRCVDIDWAMQFYTSVFELEEVGRHGDDTVEVVDLSDGIMNLALYKVKSASHPDSDEPLGLAHIGFVVKDIAQAVARAEGLGATAVIDPRVTGEQDPDAVWGIRMRAPDGVPFDVSRRGWVGNSGIE
jgi:catechol 2,3-dioxygenase-like lactoylglutathione lyase family enzyme